MKPLHPNLVMGARVWRSLWIPGKGSTTFMLRRRHLRQLVHTIRVGSIGELVVDHRLIAELTREPAKTTMSNGGLSPRERQILSLVADGLSNREIGGQLKISLETVKAHLDRAFDKMGVSNRATAVASALRLGWIE
jgi:DNA-binding NarL/FixJ family response regulator